MYSGEVMRALAQLNCVVDLREHSADLDKMANTNWKTEQRKRGSRSFDVVKKNTACGLGAEIALETTGHFHPTSPITENAEGLSFAQRKKDVECEGFMAEVKTMNAKYPVWYISGSQAESVMYSTRFNDFFLVVAYEEIQPLKYRYRPKYLINSKAMPSYIVKANTGYSEYKFDHVRAIKNGDCVDIWSMA